MDKKYKIFVVKQKVNSGELLDDYDDSPIGKESKSLERFLKEQYQQKQELLKDQEMSPQARSQVQEPIPLKIQSEREEVNSPEDNVEEGHEEERLERGSMDRPNINRMLADPSQVRKLRTGNAERKSAPTKQLSPEKSQETVPTLNRSLQRIEPLTLSPVTPSRFAKELKDLETSLRVSRNRSKRTPKDSKRHRRIIL